MAVHITCPDCKKQVPFGRLFCTFCGAKLDLSQENVSTKLSMGEATAKIRKVVVRLVVFVLVFGALGLFFWPIDPPGQTGAPADAALCERRIEHVRTRALNGVIMTEAFGEAEVNAWLKDKLSKTSDLSAGGGFSLKSLTLGFLQGSVTVQTRLGLGPVTIAYTIDGKPLIDAGGHYVFNVTGVRIGHVPMPEPVHAFFAERALNSFAGMTREVDTLAKLRRIDVRPGQVQVSNSAR